MNEKFHLKELLAHRTHGVDPSCRVCQFIDVLIENMNITDMREIYLYTASRDMYYR